MTLKSDLTRFESTPGLRCGMAGHQSCDAHIELDFRFVVVVCGRGRCQAAVELFYRQTIRGTPRSPPTLTGAFHGSYILTRFNTRTNALICSPSYKSTISINN